MRPSAILEMETAWGAYQLDLAVLTVGREIENGLQKGEKIETLLAPRVRGGVRRPAPNGDFAPMKGQAKKKVKIKNGVW